MYEKYFKQLMSDISFLTGLEKNYFCPNCKSINQINYNSQVDYDETTDKYFVVGYCHLCHKVFLFLYVVIPKDTRQAKAFVTNGVTKVTLEYVYPISIPEISNDVTPDIAKTYEEGVICLNSNAPNGAVAVFRRTLQKICIEKGATQGAMLANQISVLSSELRHEAFELKQWGNLGAHPDQIVTDVPINDAKEMKGFLERVIYVMYELPAKLNRSRTNRNTTT